MSYNKKFRSLEETNKLLIKKFEDFEKIIQIKDKEIEIEKKNYELLSKNYDKITTLIEHAIENKFDIIKNNNTYDEDNKYILIDSNRKNNINRYNRTPINNLKLDLSKIHNNTNSNHSVNKKYNNTFNKNLKYKNYLNS